MRQQTIINELSDYEKQYSSMHSIMEYPETLFIGEGTELHNPDRKENTGKRKAWNNDSWIKYWQAFSGCYSNHLKCTFCDEDIFVDKDSDECKFWACIKNKTVDDIEAVGGHYYKNQKDNRDGYIITPVCKNCNGQSSSSSLFVRNKNVFISEEGQQIEG